jgi:hypothetical protein
MAPTEEELKVRIEAMFESFAADFAFERLSDAELAGILFEKWADMSMFSPAASFLSTVIDRLRRANRGPVEYGEDGKLSPFMSVEEKMGLEQAISFVQAKGKEILRVSENRLMLAHSNVSTSILMLLKLASAGEQLLKLSEIADLDGR